MDQQLDQTGQTGHPVQAISPGRPDSLNSAPMSVLQFLGVFFIQIIPIYGIIMIFKWAFGDKASRNKRNFALAELLLTLILFVLYLAVMIVFGSSLHDLYKVHFR